MPVEIVISYADADGAAVVQLERHLAPLIRAGKILVWYRDKIAPGQNAAHELQRRMESAAIIILLASSDLEIERDRDIEMALKQREQRGARVIPVLLRPLSLEDVRYSALRMLPDGSAISLRRDKDQAWVEVVTGLRKVIASLTAISSEQADRAMPQENLVTALAPPPSSTGSSPKTVDPIKILFLAANPTNMTRLALAEEVREISCRIQTGTHRERFQLEQAWAVTVSDLSQTLLRHRPVIVHFSGHGSNQGELMLLQDNGQGITVPGEALAALFRILAARGIRCVVLNACYSEPQAKTIAQYIDCVIGVSGGITGAEANAFTAGFYAGLAEGENLQMAFDLGCAQMALLGHTGSQKPTLITRAGVDSHFARLFH